MALLCWWNVLRSPKKSCLCTELPIWCTFPVDVVRNMLKLRRKFYNFSPWFLIGREVCPNENRDILFRPCLSQAKDTQPFLCCYSISDVACLDFHDKRLPKTLACSSSTTNAVTSLYSAFFFFLWELRLYAVWVALRWNFSLLAILLLNSMTKYDYLCCRLPAPCNSILEKVVFLGWIEPNLTFFPM